MIRERRKHPRACVSLAATAFSNSGKLGDYLAQNLSAGGVLLAKGEPIVAGTELQLVLQGPGVDHLTLEAVAVRLQVTEDAEPVVAVRFTNVTPRLQDFLQRVVLRALERGNEPAVLAAHQSPIVLASMAREIVALGHRPVLAASRFEVRRMLRDRENGVRAVLVELTSDRHFAFEVLHLVREHHPHVRRIALCRGVRDKELAWVLAHAQVVLDAPWTPSELRAALRGGESGAAGARRQLVSDGPP